MLHDYKDDVVAMAHQVSLGHSNSIVLLDDILCTLVRDDLDLEYFHFALTLLPDLVKGLEQNMKAIIPQKSWK